MYHKENSKNKEIMKRQVSFGSLLKEMNIDTENKTLEELEDAITQQQLNDDDNSDNKNIKSAWDNKCTLDTFNDWINVSAYKIACLDLIIQKYRWRLQNYILLGLIFSTASGTISVTQFGSYNSDINFALNFVFTVMSFTVAILTGAVKTFKLQENLEEYINLKQNWIAFSARITSEIYLPKRLRSDAEFLIKDSKTKFLDLLKIDVPVPKHMLIRAAKNVDKGDSVNSQYYEYLENKHKLEQGLQGGCMSCLSFMFDCCHCIYDNETAQKIIENKELAKKIKFSKIDNAKKYKQKAYQYTLSSIMLNGVRAEVNNLTSDNQNTIECQTEITGNYPPLPPSVETPKKSRKSMNSAKKMFHFIFGENSNAPEPDDTHFWENFANLQHQIHDLQSKLQQQQQQISSSQHMTMMIPSSQSQSQTDLTLQINEEAHDSISSLETLENSSDTTKKEDCDYEVNEIQKRESSDNEDLWGYRYC
jgi:hypothetical protein